MAKKAKLARPRKCVTAVKPAQKPFDCFKVFDCVKHVDQTLYPGAGVVIGGVLTELFSEPSVCVRYRDGAFYWFDPSHLTYA